MNEVVKLEEREGLERLESLEVLVRLEALERLDSLVRLDSLEPLENPASLAVNIEGVNFIIIQGFKGGKSNHFFIISRAIQHPKNTHCKCSRRATLRRAHRATSAAQIAEN